jgi:hypothetical protein
MQWSVAWPTIGKLDGQAVYYDPGPGVCSKRGPLIETACHHCTLTEPVRRAGGLVLLAVSRRVSVPLQRAGEGGLNQQCGDRAAWRKMCQGMSCPSAG